MAVQDGVLDRGWGIAAFRPKDLVGDLIALFPSTFDRCVVDHLEENRGAVNRCLGSIVGGIYHGHEGLRRRETRGGDGNFLHWQEGWRCGSRCASHGVDINGGDWRAWLGWAREGGLAVQVLVGEPVGLYFVSGVKL